MTGTPTGDADETAPFTSAEWQAVQENGSLRTLAARLAFDAPDTNTIGDIRAAVRRKMRETP